MPPTLAPPACVLLVDDDAELRTVLRETLERAGFTVVEAADGLQAMVEFVARSPDVVVTDIFMPEADGFELLAYLGAYIPRVPVVVISGGGQSNDPTALQSAQPLGAREVLAKPFGSAALLDALRRARIAPPAEHASTLV